jgi:hypothetical protein
MSLPRQLLRNWVEDHQQWLGFSDVAVGSSTITGEPVGFHTLGIPDFMTCNYVEVMMYFTFIKVMTINRHLTLTTSDPRRSAYDVMLSRMIQECDVFIACAERLLAMDDYKWANQPVVA